MKRKCMTVAAVVVWAWGIDARADVFDMPPGLTSLDMVHVGDAGNAADTRYSSLGPGSVAYPYRMGKYEVSVAQYIDFLNAVATIADPHELFRTTLPGIERSGSAGAFTYVPSGGDSAWLNKPVTGVYVSNVLRFANWLHNGQPVGLQNQTTTEDGAYTFVDGQTSGLRNEEAEFWLPNHDEWYKAAFYKGDGTNAGYWEYATQSDTAPVSEAPPGGSNSANYAGVLGGFSDIGAYSSSVSAYGTCDQNGNALEWMELDPTSPIPYSARGGHWSYPAEMLAASDYARIYPPAAWHLIGFRVASDIPEPGTLSLLALGGLAIVRRRRR